MEVSTNGLSIIKKYEGCKLTAYKDSVGVWSIGYGHTSGVKEGMTITQVQAESYLKQDCANAVKYVNKHNEVYNFNQNQFDALVSFTFNLGATNLTKLTNNDRRTIAEISAKITAYNKAGGKVLAGLTKRRNEEKTLFDKSVTTSTTTTKTVKYYPAYTGSLSNLDAILKAVGLPAKYIGSVAKRKIYVSKAGIMTNYSGTYAQNLQIIKLAKAGKLKVVD